MDIALIGSSLPGFKSLRSQPLKLMTPVLMTPVLIMFFLIAGIYSPDAHAGDRVGKCGGENQRPCKVWEAIPSCDAGLKEHFLKGKCIKKKRPAPPPPEAEARPSHCGGQDQPPCKIWEAIPSCDAGLVENFLDNSCVVPGQGTQIGDLLDEAAGSLEELTSSIHLEEPDCFAFLFEHGIVELGPKALYDYKMYIELPADIVYEAVPKDTWGTPARVAAAVALYSVKFCALWLEREVELLKGNL